MIAIFEILRCGGMHFFATMAVITGHGEFTQMYISLSAIAEKLVANSAAMASRTLVHRIGLSTENVAINKPATDIFGSAHVTGAATGVTRDAVAFTPFIDVRPGIGAGSFLKKSGEGRQGCMQRPRGRLRYLFVALSTGFLGIVY